MRGESPILFQGTMVRSILADIKTMTRRVVKDINPTLLASNPEPHHIANALACPYGQSGDLLWVRESGYISRNHKDPSALKTVVYSAGEQPDLLARFKSDPELKPMPSIHMPRWASRITLEVTGVRVERLQDISEEDAVAEGVYSVQCNDLGTEVPYYRSLLDARALYRLLWESINGPGSWDANPLVWVVEFRRLP